MEAMTLCRLFAERRSRPAMPILAGFFALSCLMGSTARAGVQPQPFQDWSQAFLLQASAPSTDTRVRFGFNPFASSGLGRGEYPPDPIMPSTAPTIVIDVPSGTDPLTGFEILFAMDEALTINAPGEPDRAGVFVFQLLLASGGVAFDVTLDITTSGGGLPMPGSWTFFNPSLQPPGFVDGAGAAGFAFQFSSFSQATVVMQITDPQGNLLSFIDAPEPETLVLSVLGLLGLFWVRYLREGGPA